MAGGNLRPIGDGSINPDTRPKNPDRHTDRLTSSKKFAPQKQSQQLGCLTRFCRQVFAGAMFSSGCWCRNYLKVSWVGRNVVGRGIDPGTLGCEPSMLTTKPLADILGVRFGGI